MVQPVVQPVTMADGREMHDVTVQRLARKLYPVPQKLYEIVLYLGLTRARL